MGLEGGDDAARHAVVRGVDADDLVLAERGEGARHVGVGVLRLPLDRVVLLADVHLAVEDGVRTGLEELGVRVGDRAVHHDDLAVLGLLAERLHERLALDLADLFVVEGGVGVDRALGQAVVGHDRDLGVLGPLDRSRDGLGVDRVHDEDVHLVGDHRVDLGVLRGRVLLGVGVDHLALAAGEVGDLLLDQRLVELLVPRGLVLRKKEADLDRVTLGGTGLLGAAAGLLRTATSGERYGHGTSGDGYGGSTHTRVHYLNLPDEAATLRPRWM